MRVEATRTFIKLYEKLPSDLQKKVKKTPLLYEDNPSHPSLKNKKMVRQENIYEILVSQNYRITYSKKGDTVILRKVGSHDLLRKP